LTLDDLERGLADALSTGRAGTPVALRVHWQLADPSTDIGAAAATVMRLAEQAFGAKASRLAAQRDPSGRQLQLLVHSQRGQTLFVTVGCGAADRGSFHLQLVGSRGIVRLEGGAPFDEQPESGADDEARWKAAVEQSVDRAESVSL
jgi:predicted regulator of Ras-like GTPase activity (Roadblock/LC7/MglB family)